MAYNEPDALQTAESLLDNAMHTPDAAEAARDIAGAQAFALVAIAKALREVQDSIDGVQSALTDQDNFGAGIHLHWINEWLKKIAEQR